MMVNLPFVFYFSIFLYERSIQHEAVLISTLVCLSRIVAHYFPALFGCVECFGRYVCRPGMSFTAQHILTH